MVFENLESFDETKDLGEHDAGPEGIQRKVRPVFGLTGSSKPDLEALDQDTRKEVQKMLKGPKKNGDDKQWLAFELLWRPFHDHCSSRCGAELMAKILITTLPESRQVLNTELHMTMGWTYQQIWLDLAGRGRGLQSQHSLRRLWTASQPPLESCWRNMEHGCLNGVFCLARSCWLRPIGQRNPACPQCCISSIVRANFQKYDLYSAPIPLATRPDGGPVWSCGENYHFLAKDWVKGF